MRCRSSASPHGAASSVDSHVRRDHSERSLASCVRSSRTRGRSEEDLRRHPRHPHRDGRLRRHRRPGRELRDRRSLRHVARLGRGARRRRHHRLRRDGRARRQRDPASHVRPRARAPRRACGPGEPRGVVLHHHADADRRGRRRGARGAARDRRELPAVDPAGRLRRVDGDLADPVHHAGDRVRAHGPGHDRGDRRRRAAAPELVVSCGTTPRIPACRAARATPPTSITPSRSSARR